MTSGASKNELSARVLRAARMRLKTVVLMSRGTESIAAELKDISASGVLLLVSQEWSGKVGENWVLDMILAEGLHLHLEAATARIDGRELGMAYTWVPDEEQPELWTLLGNYADETEGG